MELVICELYNPFLHGKADYKQMYGHYLYICNNNNSDEDSDDEDDDVLSFDEIIETYKERYQELPARFRKSPYIRNYEKITSNVNYIRPEIGTKVELPSGHVVVILKTFYLRLIQRVWKNVYRKKIQYMIMNLREREMRGRLWGRPSVVGMLSFLRK